jgi:hypothetical protein
MKRSKRDKFLNSISNPKVFRQAKHAGTPQTEYNCIPLNLESPVENVEGNVQCLSSWITNFLEENLPLGVSPLIFYPLGIIAGMCFTDPRGDKTVVVSGKPSKGFSVQTPSERWGECCIMIHGLQSIVVFDRHHPGSFFANQCRYFPAFANAPNPDDARLMAQQLDPSITM